MKPQKQPIFSHQSKVVVQVTQNMRESFGDLPKATVTLFDASGTLRAETVPVEYITNPNNQAIQIVVETSQKNGFITIG